MPLSILKCLSSFFTSLKLNMKHLKTLIRFYTVDVDVGQFTNKINVARVSSSTPEKIGSIFFDVKL